MIRFTASSRPVREHPGMSYSSNTDSANLVRGTLKAGRIIRDVAPLAPVSEIILVDFNRNYFVRFETNRRNDS